MAYEVYSYDGNSIRAITDVSSSIESEKFIEMLYDALGSEMTDDFLETDFEAEPALLSSEERDEAEIVNMTFCEYVALLKKLHTEIFSW